MTFSQTATLLVLLGSTIVFLCATKALPSVWPALYRWVLRAAILGLMTSIGVLEVPLVTLPFWSRDFSLTWLSIVVALGIVAASLLRTTPALPSILLPRRAIDDDHGDSFTPLLCGATNARSACAARTPFHSSEHLRSIFLATAIVTISLILYIIAARQNLIRVNTDMGRTDQEAYLNYAAAMQDSDFAQLGNRNRMPFFPFILALTIERGGPSEATFGQAKTVNLILSAVLLVVCGLVMSKYFEPRWAVLLTEIAAWSLFVLKAPYVQAELLYYTLVFVQVVMAVELLVRPTAGMAIALGTLAGLAHLTKASVLPGLILLVAFLLLRGLLTKPGTGKSSGSAQSLGGRWIPAVGYPVLVASFFLLTVFPYVMNSWHRFGQFFYNVNSTFYMWYDSWSEAQEGTIAHGDRKGWPDMPAEQIPSPAKYLREHTPAQIANRVIAGARGTLADAVGSYGYFKYALVLALAVIGVVLFDVGKATAIWRAHPAGVLFLAAFFVAYVLLYSWYRPILGGGNRLVLALYLPFLFTSARTIRCLAPEGPLRIRMCTLRFRDALFLGLTALLLSDVLHVLLDRSLHLYGGS
jgi:hypothetical protein